MHFGHDEDTTMFRNAVRTFAEKELGPLAPGIDKEARFPVELLPQMARMGLLGMAVPERHGGADLDAVSTAVAIEEIGRVCGSTGLSLAAHTGLGCFPINRWGSEAQKSQWLPLLAQGEGLGALCLTEPDSGSDLRAIRTRAHSQGDDWVLNGSKAWITNPSLAKVLVVFAITGDDPKARYSMLLVETDRSGLLVHPHEKKMGVRGSPTHQVTFDSVHIPKTNTLGKPGNGLRQTLETLDGGRVGIGALALGIAQGAFDLAKAYAKARTAFSKPISQFQSIQWMLADAATDIEAARLLVYRAAWSKDQGGRFTKQAAMGKLFASEMAERVTRNAIQILGSYGYSSEYPVERMYRDARLMTIGEGTSEIQRLVIARHALK